VPDTTVDRETLLELLVETTRSDDGGPALRLGDAGRWLVDALTERGVGVEVATGDWPSIQLAQRRGVVIADPSGDQAPAIVHCAVQHLRPGGLVVLCTDGPDGGSDAADVADRFELEPLASFEGAGRSCTVYGRPTRFTVHDLVFEARSTIRRIGAEDLATALEGPSPPTVVDTRTNTDRHRYGVIAGSIHAPRTVVEWHLDPANGYRHPAVESLDQPIVIVCNGGYSSSLAAANLVRLGFTDVADLIGGMRAWTAAGHPTVEPDHSHLDI
jgi:rhodanese-related sulfurtransferase